MRVITEIDQLFRAKTEVIFPDRVEHLGIVEDEENSDGDTYAFIWRTDRNTDHPLGKATYELARRLDFETHGDVTSGPIHVWSLIWRGSLGACVNQLGEVHGDLLLEQAAGQNVTASTISANAVSSSSE